MDYPTASRPQIANTIYRDELYLRCVFCGDSKRSKRKAHLSVNITTGAYYCYRCNTKGLAPAHIRVDLLGVMPGEVKYDKQDFEDLLPQLLKGSKSGRKTKLPTYHYQDEVGRFFDAFLLWDDYDTEEPVGVLLRNADGNKFSKIVGEKHRSWPYAPDNLTSSADTPLRIVEGPYDVLGDNDVAIHGLITRGTLQELFGHYVVLCPDGDVWENDQLRFQFRNLVRWCVRQGEFTFVGVEFLPNGLDPDDVPLEQRTLIDPEQLQEFIR